MSETYDQDGNLITPDEDDENTPFAKRMRGQVSAATKRAEKAERTLAFRDADLRHKRADGSVDPIYDLFTKAYEGALDSDSIRAAAAPLGLADPPKPPIPAEELEALRRVQGTGSETSTPVTGISYEDFQAMDQESRIAFRKKHPEASKSWEQGQAYPIG